MQKNIKTSHWLDVKIKIFENSPQSLKNFEDLLFCIKDLKIPANLKIFNKNELLPGETDVAQIYLKDPISIKRGERFVLKKNNTLLAEGEIINPLSYSRKRTKPREKKEIELLAQLNDKELIKYYVEKSGIQGIEEKELTLLTSLSEDKLKSLVNELNNEIFVITAKDRKLYLSQKVKEKLENKIIEILQKYHEKNPFSPGLTKDSLKIRISSFLPESFYEFILADLARKKIIHKENDIIYLSTFKKLTKKEIENLKKNIENTFLKEGITPRDFEIILYEFKENYNAAKEIFQKLLNEGILVRISEKLVYHKKNLEKIENKVKEFLKIHKEMNISDFKKLLGPNVSRKYAIPLIEYLDKKKITRRIGNKRVLKKF